MAAVPEAMNQAEMQISGETDLDNRKHCFQAVRLEVNLTIISATSAGR